MFPKRGSRLAADAGSAVAEFVLVSGLLVVFTLSVMQLALALYIRTTILDAAAEGARFAALAGSNPADGVTRTQDLIRSAIGPRYAENVDGSYTHVAGYPAVEVRVTAPLPLIGLLGFDRGLEVTGHAAVEDRG